MGRKRTASYKRARRAKNKARRQTLIETPRASKRPSRPMRIVFYQRRNQPVFDFSFTGQYHSADQETGKIILLEDSCYAQS